MISDNFVTGDNVYLNELKNFFFEVLGMMSVTHYGAIGDGRFDNYGPLQVAIEDANRRGLQYIYVPYGRFRYRGSLLHLEGITFMGNPRAKIYNDKTGEEIPIIQFALGNNSLFTTEYTYMLNRDSYIDLSGEVGDKVNLVPIPGQNVAYYYAPIRAGEKYEFTGKGTMAKLNNSREIVFKYDFESSDPDDIHWFVSSGDGIFVISYTDTDEYEPHLWHRYWWTTEEVVDDDEKVPTSGAVYRALQNTEGARNIITGKLESDYTIQESFATELIPLSTSLSTGDKLSLENNKVVVGSGVSMVLVSGCIDYEMLGSESGEVKAGIIRLNNQTVCSVANQLETTKTKAYFQMTFQPFLLAVEEGDTLSLCIQGQQGEKVLSTSASTFLTVEVAKVE